MVTPHELLESCACHKAKAASRAVTRAYDEALRPAGIRATQLAVLVAIAADNSLSITALADFMGMDRSTLTRNLRPLEAETLIRVGTEGWRRSRSLELTEKGRMRMEQALPFWQKAQQVLKRKLGKQKWDLVHSALRDLIISVS